MDDLQIPKPWGYRIGQGKHGELIAFCNKCGHEVGWYNPAFGWIFSSAVDGGEDDEGICEYCVFLRDYKGAEVVEL